MKKTTRREIKQAAIRVTLPAFKKFETELRDVAEQYGLAGADLDRFLADAYGDMLVRCEFAQEALAAKSVPDFAMYSPEGNAEVFKSIRHMEGTGRVKAAMDVLMDLANRKGTREAYDTAVRDEVYRFVAQGR
jgi:hypothetical protein